MRNAARLAVLAGLCLPGIASADGILYQTNFESGVIDSGWGTSARLDQSAAFTRFMGRYSENTATVLNNSVSLTLPLPGDTGNGTQTYAYNLNFDFYPIDSWDGNSTTNGPDLFEVQINGSILFSYTFSNSAAGQSYPGAPTVGPAFLGYNPGDKDSIYRNISIPFTTGTWDHITIKWRSNGLQGVADESWGIDNVNVSYNSVPTPGSLALLAVGGLAVFRRRR